MNTSEIVCLSQSERQTFDQKREVVTGNRLPRDPTALFDLAGRIANSLAEKRPGVVRDLNTALELVTKLNAATYAYCVYLVIRHGAKHSAVARSFLSQAARTWHRKEKQLRRCLRVIAGIGNRLQIHLREDLLADELGASPGLLDACNDSLN